MWKLRMISCISFTIIITMQNTRSMFYPCENEIYVEFIWLQPCQIPTWVLPQMQLLFRLIPDPDHKWWQHSSKEITPWMLPTLLVRKMEDFIRAWTSIFPFIKHFLDCMSGSDLMTLIGKSLTSRVIRLTPILAKILTSVPYNCWPLLMRKSVD